MLLSCLPKLFKNKTRLFILLLLLVSSLKAQDNPPPTIPVLDVFSELETTFEVRFSFNKGTLKTIRIPAPPPGITLSEALELITKHSGLQFTQIDKRYIAVRPRAISVCATLINMLTGTPISGALIMSDLSETTSDTGGKFTLSEIPVNAVISIYYLDFKVKELPISELLSDSECPILFIDQEVNLLSTVFLKNYMARGISKNTDGGVSLSNDTFEILPSLIEPDVLQIVQILPGISSFDETASNINIRGGKSDEVLLLWDDIRMYQSGHFFGLISAFNPNLTQKVLAYKNATPPRYGESVSGVIDMTSDSTIPPHVTGGIGVNLTSASIYAKLPASEKILFNISGRTSINSTLGNPVYNQFYDRAFQNTIITNLETNTPQGLRSTDEDFGFYDISVKGIWKASKKDKVQYNFLAINNKLNFTERFLNEMSSSANESKLKQHSLLNGISWQHIWNKKWTSNIQYHGTIYVLDESTLDLNTLLLESERNEVNERGILTNHSYAVNDMLLLSGGYQYTDTEIANNSTTNETTLVMKERNSLSSNSVFINSRWKLFGKKTVVNLGGRYTSYQLLKEQFYEPRVNIFQKITEAFSLQLSGEMKNQSVFQFIDTQNKLLGVVNKRWVLANTSETILKNKQFSIGGTYSKNNWAFNTEFFYKEVTGLNAANQGFRNQFETMEAQGSYHVKGAEVSVNRTADNFTAWLGYTFMDNEYRFDAFTPSEFPHHLDVRHSLTLAATYSYKAFLFSLGSNFHSGIPYTSPVSGNAILTENGETKINYNAPNSDTLEHYIRSDLSAAYNFRIDDTFSGKLNVAFLNLFNRKNALETYYHLETDENDNTTINRIEQYSLGFTPNISFQLLF